MSDSATAATQQTSLTVASGAIVALRLFDVAYAIDLAKAETLLAKQARTASRSRLTATPPKAMAFGVPPVTLMLEPVTLKLDTGDVTASATARRLRFRCSDDCAACPDRRRVMGQLRAPGECGRSGRRGQRRRRHVGAAAATGAQSCCDPR